MDTITDSIRERIRAGLENGLFESPNVQLVELNQSHTAELWQYAKDESLWKHYTFRKMENEQKFGSFIDNTINEMESGREFSFTIIDKLSGQLSGTTSFLDIQPASRSLEIGRTWLASHLHGTGFNTVCKFLLLRFCFEQLGLIRVFFKTDSNNLRSQKAMEKIGAKYEGTLRNHMIREDGTFRHSAYYSIIESEWGDVKKFLKNEL